MVLEKYEIYNRKATNVLIHECGWSLDNKTGSWRSSKPVIDESKCNNCCFCWLFCPDGAITREDGKIIINLQYCKGCGICANECPKSAIEMEREED